MNELIEQFFHRTSTVAHLSLLILYWSLAMNRHVISTF